MSKPPVSPDRMWSLVARFLATVPPEVGLERHRDVFAFLAALQEHKAAGAVEEARRAALVLGEVCELMPVTVFYALARTAWRTRAPAPRGGGRRFWRAVALRGE